VKLLYVLNIPTSVKTYVNVTDRQTDRQVVLVVALVGRWTRDRKVAGSTPGALSSQLGQLSLPSLRGR